MSSDDLWQRFTGPATRIVQYAQEEARKLGSNTVGTEHLLVGLLREGDGNAARVLERLGVSLGRVRSEIHRQLGVVDNRMSTEAPVSWSPEAKRVLELALEEAADLNPRLGLPNCIDTEHILLGLIRDGESQAARILHSMNVDLDRVREEVVSHLGGTTALDPARHGIMQAREQGAAAVYELTVETEFSAAHCLKDYQGPCARLHGHNYRVLITIAGDKLDQGGMLLDFTEIKRICGSFVAVLDHQYLNDLPAFANQSPTSENIARHIFQRLAAALAERTELAQRTIRPVKVTVYESAKSAASYSEPLQR